MAVQYRTFDCDRLCAAWSLLDEYHGFCQMARHRKKLEEQLNKTNIPWTHVPWKLMVRTILCRDVFSDEKLKEMSTSTEECYTADDVTASQTIINALLENNLDNEENLTETWFEVEDLKQRFQRANHFIPASRKERKEMLNRILGYPLGYTDEEVSIDFNQNEEEPLDLDRVLTVDEQHRMQTGGVIELSGNRLHDAFYIYRLPQKGIWAQIQQMWTTHQITSFTFNNTETTSTDEELILIPAMDEYGYGVPYLFSTKPTESLPEGALYKYVDINCPLVAQHTQNPTIALVQQHLSERLKNPHYQDKFIGEELTVDLQRFPQEYVACVYIHDAPKDNVIWMQRIHYNRQQIATDLNDNSSIFFSRRILEAEEQYRQHQN